MIKELVTKYDKNNQFDVLINSYKQIEFVWNNKIDINSLKEKTFKSLFFSGLGGSAISADLIYNFLRADLKLPLYVNRNYTLPDFVSDDFLIIISSYSGNTEETVSVLKDAVAKKCNIVCITTGGKVEQIAEENGLPIIKVQPGFQPRYALGLSLFSLLKLLQELNIIPNHNKIVNRTIDLWKSKGEEYSKEDNQALKYAEKILGHIPIIYSAADITSAIGYRLKGQLNENSKNHAFCNVIPEMNHNEIIGWETHLQNKFPSIVINIMDPIYHPQVNKRFEIISSLIKDKGVEVLELEGKHEDFKFRFLELVYLCDWISYYLAILKNMDPSEIDYIHYLKNELSK